MTMLTVNQKLGKASMQTLLSQVDDGVVHVVVNVDPTATPVTRDHVVGKVRSIGCIGRKLSVGVDSENPDMKYNKGFTFVKASTGYYLVGTL